MNPLQLYSEPYSATGGLAAVGVLNQLGRPDVEFLEVLVREAVQNCWDARLGRGIRVDIGRLSITDERADACRVLLGEPPRGLPLDLAGLAGEHILYFSDFGTHGLRGPVRADTAGENRDFVDFVLNVGQPPDKELGGGSFGYGKAAFYLASRARTIIVDTLCADVDGSTQRRLIACALGDNFDDDRGRPFTGRHWWGISTPDGPLPITGQAAADASAALGLPTRNADDFGTTIAILAPGIDIRAGGHGDPTMTFLAEALIWNFWPRMIDSPGAARRTMTFNVRDDGRPVHIPPPRHHPRLRGFVEAMDRMRLAPGEDDDFILDRHVESHRPARRLGRLVIAKGAVAPAPVAQPEALTAGARATWHGLHHVALMRAPEIIVRYLPGETPFHPRQGYSGVFCSELSLDDAFKASEPPAHDDWVPRAIADRTQRSYVNVALTRIRSITREAAGIGGVTSAAATAGTVPLGEFADALAVLMPSLEGPGARRTAGATGRPAGGMHRPARAESTTPTPSADWIDSVSTTDGTPMDESAVDSSAGILAETASPSEKPGRIRSPQMRMAGQPRPRCLTDGTRVIVYPFELRTHGNTVDLSAVIEVLTNDGRQVETEAPLGQPTPRVHAWQDPHGGRHEQPHVRVAPRTDGAWTVEVELVDDTVLRVDIDAAAVR